jgi:tetratricopeptide (TPR) repeat protein
LAEWRPAHGGARLLLTSRRPGWEESLGVAALPLDTLLREESVALLKEFRPDLEDGIADKIAGELGDLPLALHLAGSYLKRYSAAVTPVAYLSELRGEGEHGGSPLHSSLAGDWLNVSPTDHEMHVGRTFAISYDRLDHEDEVDALALALLARSACFAPGESIPWELLSATLDDADDDDDAPVGSRRVLTLQRIDGLTRLAELGLVEVMADGAVSMHRLVAEFVNAAAGGDEVQGVVEKATFAEAARVNQAGDPRPLLAWQPHLRFVTDNAQGRTTETGANLCNELGYHLKAVAAYEDARPYYKRALVIRELVLGTEHPWTATSLNNLGLLLKTQGAYEEARPYYERALAIREEVLGTEHPNTKLVRGNLERLPG